MKYEIVGGAGPYEAAAIVAAIARIVDEQAAVAADPTPRPQQSAWVTALRFEREMADEELQPSLQPSLHPD